MKSTKFRPPRPNLLLLALLLWLGPAVDTSQDCDFSHKAYWDEFLQVWWIWAAPCSFDHCGFHYGLEGWREASVFEWKLHPPRSVFDNLGCFAYEFSNYGECHYNDAITYGPNDSDDDIWLVHDRLCRYCPKTSTDRGDTNPIPVWPEALTGTTQILDCPNDFGYFGQQKRDCLETGEYGSTLIYPDWNCTYAQWEPWSRWTLVGTAKEQQFCSSGVRGTYTRTRGCNTGDPENCAEFHQEPWQEYDSEHRTARSCECMHPTSYTHTKYTTELNIQKSGFINSAKPDILYLTVQVPKQFHSIEITFVDQDRTDANYYTDNDIDTSKWLYWDDQYEQNEIYRCGFEEWQLRVSWLNFRKSYGGVKLLDNFQTVTNGNETTRFGIGPIGAQEYQFGSVMLIKALEPFFIEEAVTGALETDALRSLEGDKELEFRHPFVVRFNRDVSTDVSVAVQTCPQGDLVGKACDSRYLSAIATVLGTEPNWEQPPYTTVTISLRTKSIYPYIFDANQPATFSYSLEPDPSTGLEQRLYNDDGPGAWNFVAYQRDLSACSFEATNDITDNYEKTCEQEWLIQLSPANCYLTGTYTLHLWMTCFYGKPTCYFPGQGADPISPTDVTLSLSTGRLCPTFADRADLTGRLCLRCWVDGYETERCGDRDEPSCAFIQGDTVDFRAEVSSVYARIVASEVLDIIVAQDIEELEPGILHDTSLAEGTLWSSAAGLPNSTFGWIDASVPVQEVTNLFGEVVGTITAPPVEILAVTGVQSSADTGVPEETAFTIHLEPRLFPVNTEGQSVVSIRATVAVTYEGFAGATGRRRRLVEISSSPEVSKNPTSDPTAVPSRGPTSIPTADPSLTPTTTLISGGTVTQTPDGGRDLSVYNIFTVGQPTGVPATVDPGLVVSATAAWTSQDPQCPMVGDLILEAESGISGREQTALREIADALNDLLGLIDQVHATATIPDGVDPRTKALLWRVMFTLGPSNPPRRHTAPGPVMDFLVRAVRSRAFGGSVAGFRIVSLDARAAGCPEGGAPVAVEEARRTQRENSASRTRPWLLLPIFLALVLVAL